MTGKEFFAAKTNEERFVLMSEYRKTEAGRRYRRFTVIFAVVFSACMLAVLSMLIVKLVRPETGFDPQPVCLVLSGLAGILGVSSSSGFYNRFYKWIECNKMSAAPEE